MPPPVPACDIPQRTDEAIIEGIHDEEGLTAAVRVLWDHHRPGTVRWIAAHAKRWRLPSEDIQDAQQYAIFILREAVEAYQQLPAPKGCAFRTFWDRLLRRRFANFVRRLQRMERHFDRSVQAMHILETADWRAAGAGRLATWRHVGGGDPACIAQLRELRECYERAFAQLDPTWQWIWEQYLDGKRPRRIAAELGLVLRQVKHLLHQIQMRLRKRLRGWEP
jgi:RNA polymerase sigma factor (sigma-70 family)